MTQSRRPAVAAALSTALGLAILAGCGNQPSDAGPTPAPTPSPTLPPGRLVTVDLHTGDRSGAWSVSAALRHDGPGPLVHPSLELRFFGPSGAVIGDASIDLELRELPPDVTWPILEAVALTAAPREVEARLIGDEGASTTGGRLVADPLSEFVDSDGSAVLLGRLVNPGAQAVEIDGVRVVGARPTGEWIAVVEAVPALLAILPGEPIPFLARLPAGSKDLSWEAYAVGHDAAGRRLSAEPGGIRTLVDDQGNPFVTGWVRNNEQEPVDVRLTALIASGDLWISAATLQFPLPLRPGEQVPFSLRAPSGGTADWRFFAAATPSDVDTLAQAAEVVGFEPAGSTLLLRVRIRAGDPGASAPTGFVTLIDDQGRPASAGWAQWPEDLAPAESVVLPVSVPLPAGFDLSRAEFEVRAASLPPPR